MTTEVTDSKRKEENKMENTQKLGGKTIYFADETYCMQIGGLGREVLLEHRNINGLYPVNAELEFTELVHTYNPKGIGLLVDVRHEIFGAKCFCSTLKYGNPGTIADVLQTLIGKGKRIDYLPRRTGLYDEQSLIAYINPKIGVVGFSMPDENL